MVELKADEYRKPHRLIAEERNKKAREENPQPISMVGGGRGSALTSFAQGSGNGNGSY